MPKAFQGLGFISGTNAERLAHTVGVAQAGTQWFETDTSAVYVWSGSAWFQSIYSGLTPASGDLTGSYPNPTITNITNAPIHNSNTTLSFCTSSTERMGIDASGRIRKPFQTYFKAHSPGGTTTPNGGKWPLTITTSNIGNNFNTSTSIFTAPVAGVYVFGGTWRQEANLLYQHLIPWVNGVASQQNGELPGLTCYGASTASFTSTNFIYTRYLNASDNIFFALYTNAGGTYVVYQQSYMFGYLLG